MFADVAAGRRRRVKRLSDRERFVLQKVRTGAPYADIGREIGLTKSAVAALVYRMREKGVDIPLRQQPTIRKKLSAVRRNRKRGDAAKLRASRPTPKLSPGIVEALMELKDDQCRWVHDDGTRSWYCGRPRKPGRPYCEEHCDVAYEKTKREAGEKEDHHCSEGD